MVAGENRNTATVGAAPEVGVNTQQNEWDCYVSSMVRDKASEGLVHLYTLRFFGGPMQ